MGTLRYKRGRRVYGDNTCCGLEAACSFTVARAEISPFFEEARSEPRAPIGERARILRDHSPERLGTSLGPILERGG